MHIQVTKQIGEATYNFTFEGSDLKTTLLKCGFLMEEDKVPTWKEGFESFKDKKVWFNVRKTKDGKYTYIERKCRDDKGRFATSTLGTYEGGDGYFWHQWEIYNPDVPRDVDKPRASDDLPNVPF